MDGTKRVEARVVIADDHPIFREGLRRVIDADGRLEVVAEASDGVDALAKFEELRPDVAVVDADMPRMDGFALARAVREKGLAVRLIFLTIHGEEDLVNEALDLGASGYVLKEGAVSEILAAIRAALAGQHYLSAPLTSYLLNRRRRADSLSAAKPGLGELTPTERRVLLLISEGKTSKEIAEKLFISHRTVENHRTNISNKLDLQGSHALLKFALKHKSELA